VAVDSADTKEIRVFRGSRGGLAEARPIPVGTMPSYRLGSADVTGDGRPDVLVPGHGDDTVRIVQWKDGVLALAAWMIPLSDKPWMVVGEDTNGDGRNDIVVVHSNAVGVSLAGSQGFSEAPGSPFAVTRATEVATGDLDGDGRADVAVGPWVGNEVTILTGTKRTSRKVQVCERPIGLAIADLDGDHRGELLAACPTENRLAVASWSGIQEPSVNLPPELARVLTDYEAAWRNRDAAALARLFAEDGFVLPNGRPPVKGRAAIQRHYTDSGGPLALRAMAFATEGAVGYIIGGFARQEGERDIGKFTLTLRKASTGRWLIVSDMDSANR